MAQASSVNNIGERIINFLQNNGPSTAKIISKQLNLGKDQVNRYLYHDISALVYMDTNTPPIWRLVCNIEKEEKKASPPASDAINIIFVDLGNIHHMLAKLEPYANESDCIVYAFADVAFSGYGVNPPPKNSSIKVIKSTSMTKNASDIQLIWKAAELVLNQQHPHSLKPGSIARFFIVTKDQGFMSLGEILRSFPLVKEVKFCQNYEDIREYIE